MGLNLIEVTETLAYYSMLRRKPEGRYHIQVCTNISCMLRGGNELYQHVQKRLGIGNKEVSPTGTFSLEEVECIGACTGAPAIQVNYDYHENLDPAKIDAIFEQLEQGKRPKPVSVISGAIHERHPAEVAGDQPPLRNSELQQDRCLPQARRLSGARKSAEADDARSNHRRSEEIESARTRRRGLPCRHEVELRPQRNGGKPKYIIANGDESEPGTSKDRPLMEMDPHQLIEGMIIAGRAVGAERGYIYIRGEYRYVIDIVDAAIVEAYAKGYLGKNILGSGFDFDLVAHTGAGAYECGEESALMESLEGKRGYPRIRPPFPAVVGLYGCPTVINNVETLSSVPAVILRGAEWYAGLGTPKNGGTRLFCSFRARESPGNLRTADGLQHEAHDRRSRRRRAAAERKLKRSIPGGSSCPLLTGDEIDIADGF